MRDTTWIDSFRCIRYSMSRGPNLFCSLQHLYVLAVDSLPLVFLGRRRRRQRRRRRRQTVNRSTTKWSAYARHDKLNRLAAWTHHGINDKISKVEIYFTTMSPSLKSFLSFSLYIQRLNDFALFLLAPNCPFRMDFDDRYIIHAVGWHVGNNLNELLDFSCRSTHRLIDDWLCAANIIAGFMCTRVWLCVCVCVCWWDRDSDIDFFTFSVRSSRSSSSAE